MITAFIDSGQIPDPRTNPQVLPCVFTPMDIFFTDHDANGFHNFFFHLANVPYAWIRNNGDLAFLSAVFSHELAEACTDPFDDGVFGDNGSCGQSGKCEIADYCYGRQPDAAADHWVASTFRPIGRSRMAVASCPKSGACQVG